MKAVEPKIDLAGMSLDWAALAGQTPPPRKFAWNPWIPAKTATLIHGFGGAGKTLLGQQICTAYALGLDLFGGKTEGRPALMIAGEDDHDEIWRRQIDVCNYFGIGLTDLVDKLHIRAVPHLDVTLAQQAGGTLARTPMFDAIQNLIVEVNAGLVTLDNASKMFAINEIDRAAVTRCLGYLNAICHDGDCSVLLIAHNNRTGDFSGSSAWENAVRSRLALVPDKESETVTLSRPKANYAADGSVTLRWTQGAFHCETEAAMSQGERLTVELERRQHVDTFLSALDALSAQQRAVSHSPRAGNYAPKVMIEAGLVDGLTVRQLKAAMEVLFKESRIVADKTLWQKADRHFAVGIGRK